MLNKTKTKNQTFKATGIVCATALALWLYAPRVEAFGGFGILGHKSNHKGGVNAIGVHINGKGKADINFTDGETEPGITCPDGVSKDQKGFCAICDNGNLYFSYRDDPCGEETNINKQTCSSPEDCESGCCSENGWCAPSYCEWGCFVEENTCRSNDDCATGEFCNIGWTGADGELCSVYFGTCQPIGSYSVIGYNNNAFVEADNEHSFPNIMGAMNWCHVMGMEMASLTDLGFLEDFSCSPWSGASCGDLDMSMFMGPFYVKSNDIKTGKEEDVVFEYFRGVDPRQPLIGWGSDSDSLLFGGGALCVVNCPAGTYLRDGKCDSTCGEYEHVPGSACICDSGFVWSAENKACICPEHWHIVNGECVECANDEMSEDVNATACIKLDCGPDACCYFQHRCDCTGGCR